MKLRTFLSEGYGKVMFYACLCVHGGEGGGYPSKVTRGYPPKTGMGQWVFQTRPGDTSPTRQDQATARGPPSAMENSVKLFLPCTSKGSKVYPHLADWGGGGLMGGTLILPDVGNPILPDGGYPHPS